MPAKEITENDAVNFFLTIESLIKVGKIFMPQSPVVYEKKKTAEKKGFIVPLHNIETLIKDEYKLKSVSSVSKFVKACISILAPEEVFIKFIKYDNGFGLLLSYFDNGIYPFVTEELAKTNARKFLSLKIFPYIYLSSHNPALNNISSVAKVVVLPDIKKIVETEHLVGSHTILVSGDASGNAANIPIAKHFFAILDTPQRIPELPGTIGTFIKATAKNLQDLYNEWNQSKKNVETRNYEIPYGTQILVPCPLATNEEQTYLSVSPLYCSGLTEEVSNRIWKVTKEDKNNRNFRQRISLSHVLARTENDTTKKLNGAKIFYSTPFIIEKEKSFMKGFEKDPFRTFDFYAKRENLSKFMKYISKFQESFEIPGFSQSFLNLKHGFIRTVFVKIADSLFENKLISKHTDPRNVEEVATRLVSWLNSRTAPKNGLQNVTDSVSIKHWLPIANEILFSTIKNGESE